MITGGVPSLTLPPAESVYTARIRLCTRPSLLGPNTTMYTAVHGSYSAVYTNKRPVYTGHPRGCWKYATRDPSAWFVVGHVLPKTENVFVCSSHQRLVTVVFRRCVQINLLTYLLVSFAANSIDSIGRTEHDNTIHCCVNWWSDKI